MGSRRLVDRIGGPAIYLAMIGLTVGGFLAIRSYGEDLQAPAPQPGTPLFGQVAEGHVAHAVLHVLLALAVVTVSARLLGLLFQRLEQPLVVGEIIAGIVLGPSLLGRCAPELQQFLFPDGVAPLLSILAQVGVILYMFLVGLELDPDLIRKRTHAAVAISHASIILPFLLGSALALFLYPILSTRDVPFTAFALFMAISMSVTAFPVLARILTDRGMSRTRFGALALTCAAVDDVTAWCLLAIVVGVARTRPDAAVRTIVLAVAYVSGMLLLVRPLLSRAVRALDRRVEARPEAARGVFALAAVALLLSALATDAIGIHAIFGAFLLGAIIPHDSALARRLVHQLEDVVIVLFLPAFFAFTGLRTQVGLVSSAGEWIVCATIVAVACLGKFGGSALAGRVSGLSWRDASAVGVLMNTRGLMELIVLNIGLDLHVLSPALFTMLVLMAVATTMMTTPILRLLKGAPERMRAEPSPVS